MSKLWLLPVLLVMFAAAALADACDLVDEYNPASATPANELIRENGYSGAPFNMSGNTMSASGQYFVMQLNFTLTGNPSGHRFNATIYTDTFMSGLHVPNESLYMYNDTVSTGIYGAGNSASFNISFQGVPLDADSSYYVVMSDLDYVGGERIWLVTDTTGTYKGDDYSYAKTTTAPPTISTSLQWAVDTAFYQGADYDVPFRAWVCSEPAPPPPVVPFGVSLLDSSDVGQSTYAPVSFPINFSGGLNNSFCVVRNSSGSVFASASWVNDLPLENLTFPAGDFRINFTPSTDLSDNFSVNCTAVNFTDSTLNDSTVSRLVIVDTVEPAVATNFTNLTMLLDDVTNFNWGLSDENLFSYEIVLSNGTVLSNNSNILGTDYTVNLSLNRGDYAVGFHTFNLTVTDGHTAMAIDDYGVSKNVLTKSLTFTFPEERGGWVKVVPKNLGDLASSFDAVKGVDRYNFVYRRTAAEKLLNGEDLSFRVESSSEITVVSKNGFPAHLVIKELGKWVDFASLSDVGGYEVKRVSDSAVDVVVRGVRDDVAVFSSIGDLNIVYYEYGFGIVSTSVVAAEVAVELQAQSIVLNVNLSDSAPSYISSAMLNYNNSWYPSVRSRVGSVDVHTASFFNPAIVANSEVVSFYWNFSVSGLGANVSNSTDETNQTLFKAVIDDCSVANDTAINFSIYNEQDAPFRLVAGLEVTFDYWISDRSFFSLNNSYSRAGANHYLFCMQPQNETLYYDAYFKYTTAGGFTHRYIVYNGSVVGNLSQDISAYNFNTTTSVSDMRLTLRYVANYSYFAGVVARLQRQYTGENVWRTVQMDESGDFGLVFFNIEEEDTDYRILFYDRTNTLLRTTDRMKFSCNSGLCELTFLLTEAASVAVSDELVIDADFNNATGTLNVSWSDASAYVGSVRVLFTRDTMTGSATICDVSQSGSAGSVWCNASGFTGALRLVVFSGSDDTPRYSEWFKNDAQSLATYIGNVEGAFWTGLILITVFGFGIISPAVAVLALLFGLVGVFFLGIMNAITITFLGVAFVLGIIIGIKVRT